MVSKKKRELMLRIIDLAKSVREKGIDPFEVEVEELFQRLREIFPEVEDPEELLLDVRAVLGLTDVISQQGDWIKHKSSLLYFDPMLVQWKLRELSGKQLARVLTKSWHPIVGLECISQPGIRESVDYWTNLAPLSERGIELETTEVSPGEVGLDALSELGVESEKDFNELIEKTWRELKEIAGEEERVSYWDFVDAENFHKTVRRAWLVSFLVSYGYATLEIQPLEEEIIIKPRKERKTPSEEVSSSIPVSISHSDWKARRTQSA
ncbi:hypothetical protein AKJ48_02610 [candidate division MSBL1 archaeon SCGC-AAA261O19]|uniref:Uncharacterized protein n=2 Tax=candidate division MSBL1 TaxID=215777 RepID=A0A133VDA8_9EURY|nr:hypothetical protein AKJ48_02610 [candidate division MSBL1 archaeon SCGC-AAA261O19]